MQTSIQYIFESAAAVCSRRIPMYRRPPRSSSALIGAPSFQSSDRWADGKPFVQDRRLIDVGSAPPLIIIRCGGLAREVNAFGNDFTFQDKCQFYRLVRTQWWERIFCALAGTQPHREPYLFQHAGTGGVLTKKWRQRPGSESIYLQTRKATVNLRRRYNNNDGTRTAAALPVQRLA